jgi:APA family basic amino acid/polyamine antiporter
LQRNLGLPQAVLLGLGSILGTGVFVSLALAAAVAGAWALPAVLLAAGVAACNGMSSAALAAEHPVSGGTYEYGYRLLSPLAGFSAGWLFLLAKSASAAAAALGCAGYILSLSPLHAEWRPVLGALLVVGAVLLVLQGARGSALASALSLACTLFALLCFIGGGLPLALQQGKAHFAGLASPPSARAFLEAAALLFVAFTGYGRLATLGEEVREPRRTIPRAILVTLMLSAGLYLAVTTVAIGSVGAGAFGAAVEGTAAPLAQVARGFGLSGLPFILGLGAVSAMFGVLLNLVLGLSRVAMAMGRRGDLPMFLARVDAAGQAPAAAVLAAGGVILTLVLAGSVKTNWSFSAFTVLIYYSLTNAAALRLPGAGRARQEMAWLGLGACLALALCIELPVLLAGVGLLGVGWILHGVRGAARARLGESGCA